MNTLQFLKNGSRIHIKEKNKGSFTRWCGGNVTEECIRRGKASSNPKIRKKATFADNARKWKHKNGGKAFVKGINVLDSNPNAYKYVKKKYKMHLQGGNINWGSTLANIGSNILQTYLLSSAKDKFGKEYDEVTNKLAEAMKSKSWGLKYEEGLKLAPKYFEQNSLNGINYSTIDYQQFAKNYADSNLDLDAIENFKLERELLKKLQIDAILGTSPLGNILLQGLGMVGDYLNNKSSKTSFNKKADFGNIKTDFGLLGTYSVNSGYLPKQLSFDWSKVGNIK